MTDTAASTCNPSFAYVTINIPGLSLNFQVADRAGLSTFFNDHKALADIRAGMDVINGTVTTIKAQGLTIIERKALDHALTTGADAAAVTTDNAKAEGADADYLVKETVLTAVQVDPAMQQIQTGEERTEGETTTPPKRVRRTKAEMEAARLAEAASKADAGAVPALPATPAPAAPVAPAPAAVAPAAVPALPDAPAPVASLPSLPVMPTLPSAPAPVAQNPAMLAGQVIDAIQALVDEGRDPTKMVEWLFAYGIVNSKDVGYETAQATIRLMNDAQLQKVAEALGLLDD